ncbi:developmentally-regulated protein, partial [Acrasis kona]
MDETTFVGCFQCRCIHCHANVVFDTTLQHPVPVQAQNETISFIRTDNNLFTKNPSNALKLLKIEEKKSSAMETALHKQIYKNHHLKKELEELQNFKNLQTVVKAFEVTNKNLVDQNMMLIQTLLMNTATKTVSDTKIEAIQDQLSMVGRVLNGESGTGGIAAEVTAINNTLNGS